MSKKEEERDSHLIQEGLHKEGYNKEGYNVDGYNREGYKSENIITLSDEDVIRIRKFIPKRFGTIQEFVTRAINVNVAWEENPFTSMDTFAQKSPTIKQYDFLKRFMDSELLDKMFPKYPAEFGEEWEEYEKNNIVENKNELENNAKRQREERKDRMNFTKLQVEVPSSQNYVEAQCKNIIDDKNEIKYDGWPLLFGHYSRIFPAQIGLHVLGNLMRKLNSTMINFDTFTKEAYDVAEEIAEEYLEKEKKDDRLKRVKKISIGLPKPYEDNRITAEQSIKEQRYKDRNFGKIKKTKDGNKTLEGLMSALGLIRVFHNKDEVLVTFSEAGKKLYSMKNPIFNKTDDTAFSDKEQEYIIKYLISKRVLEAKLLGVAKKIIQNSKSKVNVVKDIEQAFQDEIKKFAKTCSDHNTSARLEKMIKITEDIIETNLQNKAEDRKQTAIEAVRIATLGRMAEVGIINWETNSERKTLYSIAKKN